MYFRNGRIPRELTHTMFETGARADPELMNRDKKRRRGRLFYRSARYILDKLLLPLRSRRSS